jgi:hypothetical protein
MKQPVYIDDFGLFTVTPTTIPLYICDCGYPSNGLGFKIKEEECIICLSSSKRAVMGDDGIITPL